MARAVEDLRLKTASFDVLFKIGEASWALDQGTGIIKFTSPDGVVATAPAQIIGTFNTEDRTWLWAWDNPTIDEKLRVHSARVRAYGERHKIEEFTTRKFRTTEERAWELTALACRLGEYQGAYRGPDGVARVFITFGDVELKK